MPRKKTGKVKVYGPNDVAKYFEPQGVAKEIFDGPHCHDRELLLSGPAGTGKSRVCLEKLNAVARVHAGCRLLMVRKTRASLTNTGLVTFEQWVLPQNTTISLHSTTQTYIYPNGSKIVVGGLDKATKIMSAEYDIIFVQEATELTILDWESLLTRLRNGVVPYQQIIADCNPDAPSHWLNQRSLPQVDIDRRTGLQIKKAASLRMLTTSHEDNPRFYDLKKSNREIATDETGYYDWTLDPGWTAQGRDYLTTLDQLTGVRRERLRYGIWTSAEGAIFTEWDTKEGGNLINRERVIDVREFRGDDGETDYEEITEPVIQPHWRCYWTVDFGFSHPFVWQQWREDGDGRLYLEKEIHMAGRIVADHCKTIKEVTKNDPPPEAVITDHDLEGRMTLERELGVKTVPAYKAVKEGIQAVKERMRRAGDGKPRLFILRDSVVEIDKESREKRKPCSTEEEIPSYVWYSGKNYMKHEEPVKEDDDGCDAMRYMVAFKDCRGAAHGAPASGGVRTGIVNYNQRQSERSGLANDSRIIPAVPGGIHSGLYRTGGRFKP